MSESCNTTHFDESLRYQYPLSPKSRVIDCGYFKGTFAHGITTKYNCRVDAYEPVREWYEFGSEAVGLALPKVHLYHGAVGCWRGTTKMVIKGDSTGAFADPTGREIEETPLHLIDDVIGDGCDLLKLNIEGGEFDVLERMIKCDLAERCRDIQVQFHTCVPETEKRYEWIKWNLLTTHFLTYHFPWCWENYQLRPA